jgi:small subunit ribosomal protein S4
MRRSRKKYNTPKHPWQAARISEEAELLRKYDLRSKREIWKADSMTRGYRRNSRRMSTSKEVIDGLKRKGILGENAGLDDVLRMRIDDLLERRLQTLVFRRGLAKSIKQARQFIVHGHISIAGRKITVPGYIVNKNEEDQIDYYIGSPLGRV